MVCSIGWSTKKSILGFQEGKTVNVVYLEAL